MQAEHYATAICLQQLYRCEKFARRRSKILIEQKAQHLNIKKIKLHLSILDAG
jgi:hypothetical protein